MADPAVVQAKSARQATGSPVSVTLDAAPTEGNTLYAIVSGESDLFALSGWAEEWQVDLTGFQRLRAAIFSKVAGASESATVSVTNTSAQDTTLTVIEVSNAGTFSLGTGQDQSFDTSPTVLGQTTAANGALHVPCVFHAASDSTTNTAPSGYTAADILAAANTLVAYKTIVTAGATGDQTFAAGAGGGGTGYTRGFVIEPTGGGGGGQPTQKRAGGVPWMGQHGAGFPSAIQRWIRRESGLQVPAYYRERRAA